MSDESAVSLVGLTGRISVPVPPDGPGEIIISIRGASEAFTYTNGGEELAKNSRAAVVEQTGARTVLVTGF